MNRGHAEYMLASTDHPYLVPDTLGDAEAAPLFGPAGSVYTEIKARRTRSLVDDNTFVSIQHS